MVDLHTEVSHALALACEAPHGRHAQLLIHDGPLRQSVIALRAGARLPEHNSPPAASIQVLRGALYVTGEAAVHAVAGELLALTHRRHAVEAQEDSVFLLITITSQEFGGSHGAPSVDN
jgi:quercetin dioxygenase-like cupin family protein